MNSLLTGLNKEQQQAVQHTEGPLLILAGAGSGKTKVLTVRIAHLLAQGVNPYEILAITFTNKAAKEMKNRVEGLVGDVANRIWLSTFHSFCAKFLRFELDNFLGYNSNFTIYDTSDSQAVIKAALKALNLDDKYYPVGAMIAAISDAKNKLLFASDFRKQARDFYQQKVADVYEYYERELRKNNALDFDDLLLVAVKLLQSNEAVLDKYSKRFRYVMIDEYQDTNHAQYLLAKLLASHWKNIAVVGDADQSIYAWRGADIQNILDFEKDYPNCTSIKLEQNYRSTRMIVDAANSVIARNINQFPKNVFSENEEGDKIKIYRALSDADEASFVATNIWDLHLRDKRRFSDIAVLYRTNSQTRAIEDALRKKNIPYKVYGGLSFYQRKEVKDLMAYLRILVNDNDNEALIRVINYPTRGIGETTQNKLIVFADSIDLPLSKVLDNISFYSSQLGLNNSVINKLNDFWQMIQAFRVMLKTENAYNVTMEVAKRSGLLRVLKEDQTPEGVSRIENIQEVMNSLQGFIEEQQQLDDGDPSLSNFLENIALSTDTEKKDEEDGDRVSLMTIHLSKGLEFPVVHLVGLEENLFPSIMSSNTRDELEEERRLFYVALTRAEKQIFLSYATFRYQWGKNTSCEPSRFITEVDSHHLDFLNPNIERKVINRSGLKSNIFDETPSTPNTFRRLEPKKKIIRPINTTQNKEIVSISNAKITNGNGNIQEIQVGDKVRHDRFGVGEVILIDGTDPENIKAKIDFANEGKKNLILKFAKLYKI